jgi:phosphocarrier protein FPr
MIGLVIVSHSTQLAAGVCALVAQVGAAQVPVAAAGGLADDPNVLGTDPLYVQTAIESVYSEDGVVVLMDLGSALLSAETAVELLAETRRPHVHLCAAPLVEGAVAAATQIAAGAGLERVLAEAQGALRAKAIQLGSVPLSQPPTDAAAQAVEDQADLKTSAAEPTAHELGVTVGNRLGLHARPAAQLVQTAARFNAHTSLRNETTGGPPIDARSINQVMALGARQGHRLVLSAVGPDADAALAALSGLFEAMFGEPDTPSAAEAQPATAGRTPAAGTWSATPIAPGIAVGPLAHYRPAAPVVAAPPAGTPEEEWGRLQAAIGAARTDIERSRNQTEQHAGAAQAAIFDAHLLFLDDPTLQADVRRALFEGGQSAAVAWQNAVERAAAALHALEDAYQRERADDVADVGRLVLQQLGGAAPGHPDLAEPAILVARRLSPSDISALDPTMVLGLCADFGSPVSHSAILARGLGIPAVMGIEATLSRLAEGTPVALDGGSGQVWVAPDEGQLAEIQAARQTWLARVRTALPRAHAPARTRDGRPVEVVANVGSLAEVRAALANGADGVGVLRTEFLFSNRPTAPSEEEQLAAYAAIVDVLGERPCIIRTLDVGGDKPLPYLPVEREANPFLGWRGIRIGLEHPELLKTQLRAILRASLGHRVKVMFPMVALPTEVCAARAVLAAAQAELRNAGIPFDERMEVGIMVEVPSAVVVADRLARAVDFFSIGTNDLSQYMMAADRTSPRVAALADGRQPAVLRAVQQVVQAAHNADIWAGLCGELAGDSLAVPLWLGMGLDELSVNPAAVPAIKAAIVDTTVPEAEAALAAALELDSAEAVAECLRTAN